MSDDLLQQLMDDHGFTSAIYWAPNDDDELAVKNCAPGAWCDASKEYTFPKDVGQPGRVWENEEYEYNENVQLLDPEKFLRQPITVEEGIEGLLCVPYMKNDELKGVVELGFKPIADIVETVKGDLGN